MSLVWTLRKWLDPEFRREEEERRRLRETLMPTPEPGGGDGEPPLTRAPPPAPDRVCRVCGHVGSEQEFCPSCLAGTMVPKR